jgi:GAF domain-containing protein
MAWSEDERLNALREHGILDTPAEESFDEIVRAAVQAFGVPMAAVSLVDRHRQWFKARVGLDVSETPRDVSFCAHAIQGDDVMVVPDATQDPRFADNALVTADPSLRFYAGAVIRSEAGIPLGALCVVDTVPRPDGLTDEQVSLLQMLADQVSEQLRLRRLVNEHAARAAEQARAVEAGLGREDRLRRALHSGASAGGNGMFRPTSSSATPIWQATSASTSGLRRKARRSNPSSSTSIPATRRIWPTRFARRCSPASRSAKNIA